MELRPGDSVEVVGLKATELNGIHGLLLRLDTVSERWEVKLPEGEVKAIRPENLAFRAVAPLQDDGTLVLVGMATEHPAVQRVLQRLERELREANEALQLAGHVISPGGGGGAAARGEDAGLWLKLARQAEQRTRGALEELQRNVEVVDSIDPAELPGSKAADLRLARKDLVRFVQGAQERIEGALSRLRPLLQHLAPEPPQRGREGRRHGWTQEAGEVPLHEKYRDAFEGRAPGGAPAGRGPPAGEGPARLHPIVVKYQGRGEKPPPSDNLYVKGLPGWVTEEDLRAAFSAAGEIQSMKLKTADWGAIAFVRLANRKEAARAIQELNGTIPPRLAQRAEEQEASRSDEAAIQAALGAVVAQLERGAPVILDLAHPLGVTFDDRLMAIKVEEDSQAAKAGVRRGWRVRGIGGRQLTTTSELVKVIKSLKKKGAKRGMTQAALTFAPSPLVVTLEARPFDFEVARDPSLGLFYVNRVGSQARGKGIKLGSVLTVVEGQNVSTLTSEDEVMTRLQDAFMPVELVFEQAHAPSCQSIESTGQAETVLEVSDDSDEDVDTVPSASNARTSSELTEITIDLSQSLGIFFDDVLIAKEVKEGLQASRLGVCNGWKARAVAGENVATTKELVAKLQALKAQGSKQACLAFARPSPVRQDAPAEAETSVQAKPEAAREGSDRDHAARGVRVTVNLSQPLGIFFDDALLAKEVKEGSQAHGLGVRNGWRATAVGGEQVTTTKELVSRLQALKAQGERQASLAFLPEPGQAPPLEEPTQVHADSATSSSHPGKASTGTQIVVNLSQPLGIFFDDALTAKDVKDGSQAYALGIRSGWRATGVGGETVATTKELVAKLQALKARGDGQACIVFVAAPDAVQSSSPGGDASASPRAEAAAAGSRPEGAVWDAEVTVDLSRPLGILFDDALVAKEVKEGSQAQDLGVRSGWRARAVDGEAVESTQGLVARVQAARARGAAAAALAFERPAPGTGAAAPEEPPAAAPPAKRARAA